MRQSIPFSIDRNDARPLVDQVADGMRQAIVSGYWRTGDELPSTRELVPLLGVSHIVTRAALSRLAAEGYVLTRHGLKPVVRDPGAKQWRGHVVFVSPEDDIGFFQTVMGERVRTRLNKAGWLFTRATVEGDGAHGGAYDFALLDAALSRSVDLVVVLYNRPAIFSHLAKLGVPFAVVAGMPKAPAGAIGFTDIDFNTAVPDLIAACRADGVGKVIEYRLHEGMCDAVPALRAAGIAAKSVMLRPDYAKGKFYAIEEAGMNAVAKAISTGRFEREAVHFFSSEYLARGALLALSRAGLESPRDVRVVAWANAGMGPSYFRELSRMEMDPVRAGAVVSDAALAFLRKGTFPEGLVIGPKWKKGETLGGPRNQPHSIAIECNRQRSK